MLARFLTFILLLSCSSCFVNKRSSLYLTNLNRIRVGSKYKGDRTNPNINNTDVSQPADQDTDAAEPVTVAPTEEVKEPKTSALSEVGFPLVSQNGAQIIFKVSPEKTVLVAETKPAGAFFDLIAVLDGHITNEENGILTFIFADGKTALTFASSDIQLDVKAKSKFVAGERIGKMRGPVEISLHQNEELIPVCLHTKGDEAQIDYYLFDVTDKKSLPDYCS